MTAGEHTVEIHFFDDVLGTEIQASWAARNPNSPPTPTIQAPAVGAKFKVGDVITFFAIQQTGPGPLLVRFTVTDGCGDWPTFVGAGQNAGW